jgi:general stress protein 26
MTTKHETYPIAELSKKLGEIRFGMFATRSGANSRAVPMTVIEAEEDGTLWFFGARGSAVVDWATADPQVTLSFADTSSSTYAFVRGRVELPDDRAKIDDLWNPFLNAWFDGADDPAIQLMKVTIESAEYWDSADSKVGRLVGMVRAAITGDDNSTGEHGEVTNTAARAG